VINTLTAGTNLNGGGSAATVTVNLDSDISINSATFAAASPLVFEGATANDYETTVAVTDPTADRTVTIPDGSGTVAFTSSSITGNAATATALQTARTIGGVSFDGTGNINLPGVNTAGNQSTSGNAATATESTNVTATANNTTDETVYLTFVDGATGTQGIETDTGLNYNPSTGVLTTTSVTGNLTGNVTGNVSGTAGSATGNAATATALQTARNIGGVSFDGTGNIDLPGVNTAGNQNTSGSSGSTTGNAATATALATARNINGVSFDGTGNITVTAAAGTLTGSSLASGVTGSSLTSVGTLGSLTVSGTVTIDSVGITAVQTSSESFADNDTSLMTSAAIDDRINAASSASPGGSNTQVQYNGSGSFSGSSSFTFNSGTGVVTATGFAGALTGNVTGNASGSSGSCTGNAATATALETARTIGGVSFDGTGNINLPGVNTSGNQDTSGNSATATALATARNIGGVSFDGTGNIDLPGVNSAGNQNTSGNAATATALATARNINGVSFDGTGNITVTAAAGTLSGGTLASGVTASSLTSVGTLGSLNVTGAVAITGSGDVTVGVDGTSSDVKFYSDTAGSYFLWDNSEDRLDVVSSGKAAYFRSLNGTTTTFIGSDGSDTGLFGTSTAHRVRFITNDSERMTILSGGNVGIGKSDPATALDVVGTIDSTVNPPPIVETFASQSISASGTTVTFTSGRFSSAPNVMVTQANSGGGASKVPNVDNITSSSCRVFLLNTSSSFVSGDASLLATLEV
jgi:hypothetical protein